MNLSETGQIVLLLMTISCVITTVIVLYLANRKLDNHYNVVRLRPMADAPRDGSSVLLCTDDFGHRKFRACQYRKPGGCGGQDDPTQLEGKWWYDIDNLGHVDWVRERPVGWIPVPR